MKWHEIGQVENAPIAGGQGLFPGHWTAKKTRYQRDGEEDAWKDTASSYRPSTCIFGTALAESRDCAQGAVKGGEKPDQRAEQNTATAAVGVRWSEGVGMRPGAVSAGNEGRA